MTEQLVVATKKETLINFNEAQILHFNGLKHYRLEQGDYVAFGFTNSEHCTLVKHSVLTHVMANAHKVLIEGEIEIPNFGTATIEHRPWGDTVFLTSSDAYDFKGIPFSQLLD